MVVGNKNRPSGSESESNTSIIFGIKEKVGALAIALKPFEANGITLNYIESRPSKRSEATYEFLITTDSQVNDNEVKAALGELTDNASYVQVLSRSERSQESVPWFPRKKKDLDQFAHRILSYGSELDSDHPGFTVGCLFLIGYRKKFFHGGFRSRSIRPVIRHCRSAHVGSHAKAPRKTVKLVDQIRPNFVGW